MAEYVLLGFDDDHIADILRTARDERIAARATLCLCR